MEDLDSLSLEFTASAGNVSKTFQALENRLSKLDQMLAKIDTSKIDRMAAQFDRLGNAVNGFSGGVGLDKQIRSLATALNRFQSVDTASVARATSVITSLGYSINSFNVDPAKADAFRNVASALNMFGRVKAVSGVQGITTLASGMRDLFHTFDTFDNARLEEVSQAIERLAQALNVLGRTKVDKAIANIPLLAKAMQNLMKSLARAPNVSRNVIQMTNALANLASQGQKVGTATAGLNRAINNSTKSSRSGASGLRLFGNAAASSKKHVKDLASAVGGLIAKYWILIRAIQGIGKIMGIASSLTEVENVVSHVFGHATDSVNEFAQNAIEKFGMSELSAKQYASRFQAMATAMEIPDSFAKNANTFIDSKISGIIDKNISSYAALGDSMADVSINLTKLTADYASFYDVAQEEVAEKMTSIFTGQTRPLRDYGIDLTQATLKEWALKNGLDADIASMSQAEKAMLRYQYVMANSSFVMDDFSRTADTYHNLLVRIRENFKALGATVGGTLINAFKPVLRWINAAIQAVNQFAIVISNALGKIFGWKYEIAEGGQEISGLADDYEDVGDAAGGAAKKAKELNKQLQGFDELNNLTTNDDNGGGGGSGGSGGGGALGNSAKAGQWVEVAKDYESEFDTLAKLGAHIGEVWTNALTSIPWDDIKDKAASFAQGMADFFNGLISPELFGAFGQTIAETFNTAFIAIDKFATSFDWENLGNSVAQFVIDLTTTFDAAKAGTAVHNFITGLLDALTIAVDKADWYQVGVKIGDYLEKLNIPDIAAKMLKLAGKIAEGLLEALKGFWQNTDWQGKMGLVILGLIKVAKLTGLGGVLSGLISNNLPSTLNIGKTIQLAGITVAAAVTWKIGSNIGSSLGEALALSLGDDELADFYDRWRNMNLGEKLDEIHNTVSGWDDGDTKALAEFFHLDWLYDGIEAHDPSDTIGGFSDALKGLSGSIYDVAKESTDLFDVWEKQGGKDKFFDAISKFPGMKQNAESDNPISNAMKSMLDKLPDTTTTEYTGTLGIMGIGPSTTAVRRNVEFDRSKLENMTDFDFASTESAGNPILDRLNTQLKELEQNAKGASTGASKSFATIETTANKLDKNGSKSVKNYDKNSTRGLNDVSTTASKTGKGIGAFAADFAKDMSSMASSADAKTKDTSRYFNDNFKNLSSDTGTIFDKVKNTIVGKLALANTSVSEKGAIINNTWFNSMNGIEEKTENSLGNTLAKLKDKLLNIKEEVDKKGEETNTSWIGVLSKWGKSADEGMSGVENKVSSWCSIIKGKIEGVSSEAKFNVTTTDPGEIKTIFDKISGIWKDKTSKFTVNAPTENKTQLQEAYDRRKNLWKDKIAKFTIDAPTKNKEDLRNAYNNRAGLWQDKTATFTINQSGVYEAGQAYAGVAGSWQDKTATFSLSANVGVGDVDTTGIAKSAMYKMSAALEDSGIASLRQQAIQIRIAANNMHAKGGVFDKPTFGIFGEAGAEAIVPLERNLGWAKNVADLITERMPYTYNAPTYATTNYAGNSYVTYNGNSYNTDNSGAVAEQNALLREEITLLRQIADKDVSISSKDVFNAVRSENRDYMNRTGSSPFIS